MRREALIQTPTVLLGEGSHLLEVVQHQQGAGAARQDRPYPLHQVRLTSSVAGPTCRPSLEDTSDDDSDRNRAVGLGQIAEEDIPATASVALLLAAGKAERQARFFPSRPAPPR